MSQEAVERVLGRMITDERFRHQATDALETVCLQEGYCLTLAEMLLLSELEPQFIAELAGRLSPGLCRAGLTSNQTTDFFKYRRQATP